MALAKKKAIKSSANHLYEVKHPENGFAYSSKRHLFVESTLFNDVYIHNDLPREKREQWDQVESGPFHNFYTQFLNICTDLKSNNENFESWNEKTTIESFIKPVLKALGYKGSSTQEIWAEDESFTIKESGQNKTLRPDLIFVRDPRELKHIRQKDGYDKIEEAKESVTFTLEAKYWGRIEEREKGLHSKDRTEKKSREENAGSMEFDEQCLKYMSILGKQYGVLTDGKIWRIYHSELSSGPYKRYYQFKLGNLVRFGMRGFDDTPEAFEDFLEAAKYFYYFFCPSALSPARHEQSTLDELVEYSKRYANTVEEDLKLRFVDAMRIACNGMIGSKNFKESELNLVRSVVESHLFNILFVRYCEARSILPLQNASYLKISLSGLLNQLRLYDPSKDRDGLNKSMLDRFFLQYYNCQYDPSGTDLFKSLVKLTKIVQSGVKNSAENLEIKGFRESIFSEDEWAFANKYPISNKAMIEVLFQLGYSKSGTKYQQIPYNFFSPRQLGSIYESFLEFRLERASTHMYFETKGRQWKEAMAEDLDSDKMRERGFLIVRRGDLFFSPNNKDRKDSGSYYTPDCVVQFIVTETLAPLVDGKSSKEIRKLKVCDPAMGSGHFLSASLNFLADAYRNALDEETPGDLEVSLLDIKQDLLHECIYGVDLNSRAVKLAKMSLWLETADPNRTLKPLDDRLKCANSLTDERLWKDEWKFLSRGLDAVVGNPPYLGEKGHKEAFQEVAKGFLGRHYLGKMDLLYFFFHLGIETIRPEGRIGFITTNYFTTALGARKLRREFYEKTNLDLLINLNEVRVFGEAAGQHNIISILTKSENQFESKVISSHENGKVSEAMLQEMMSGNGKFSSVNIISKESLFDGEEKYIRVGGLSGSSSEAGTIESLLNKLKATEFTLGDQFSVNQGIVTGADKVSPRHLEIFGIDANKGDGIFILSETERRSLRLDSEKDGLRPFYKNSDISKFRCESKTNEWVLYCDRSVATVRTEVSTHLKKYKKVLDQRREVKNNVIKWFQLQWPRERSIFEGEKIVCPQRSNQNTFGYSDGSWFAASDVFFITTNHASTLELKYALGILNSRMMYFWFYNRGKRKGEALELIAKPISEVPIKDANIEIQKKLVALVNRLIADPSDVATFDKMNDVIESHYGLSNEEKEIIRLFYTEKIDDVSIPKLKQVA